MLFANLASMAVDRCLAADTGDADLYYQDYAQDSQF